MIYASQGRRDWQDARMLEKEAFETFYARKLDALKVQLKDAIKGDMPFVVGTDYACRSCAGRIKVHSQERMYCLRCDSPPTWTESLKSRAGTIMSAYPDYGEWLRTWESRKVELPTQKPHKQYEPRVPKEPKMQKSYGDADFAKKMQDARLARGWTQVYLASIVYKKDGGHISDRSIAAYESGYASPSASILKQLQTLLGLA